MKEGMRFVDCDMHIMEPPDLFERYLDSKFKDRVVPSVGADGKPVRGMLMIDDKATSLDVELQKYRKPNRRAANTLGARNTTQPLSGSRITEAGRLDFAIERKYDAEAQVIGMEMEGIDIAVLFPTLGLSLIAMIIGGVFEFHPRLRVGFLEAQNSWVPGLLSRIEWDYPQDRDSDSPYLSLTPKEYFQRNCWAAVEGSEPEITATAGLIGADRMCISTDYPHFDSNFPNVANNLLKNVSREIAAEIFMGGFHLYGFTEEDFARADAAAEKQAAISMGD